MSRAYVRTYVRRKVFYILSVISVIRHLRKLKMYKNRCTHLTKQVHVFDKTGAPVLEKASLV